MWMRDIDFTPLMRSMIGFDRMRDLLANAVDGVPAVEYPPYDIEKLGDDAWRVSMDVAGFSPDELSVVQEQNELVITGSKKREEKTKYLYRGIAHRSFERRLELADFVEVKEARLANGLLVIELVRELPEEMRPRTIEISSATNAIESKEQHPIEQQAA
jgi:molecular chaperone IbpA